MMFIFGMSLMLNLVFIIGFIKFYKKMFGNSKEDLFYNMQEQLNLAISDLSKGKKIKANDKKDNNDLDSIFKTSKDLEDFWK